MQARVREQAVRLAAAMLGRKGSHGRSAMWGFLWDFLSSLGLRPKLRRRLLKAAGADALRAGDGSESDLWIEVERHLEENAGP